MRTKNCVGALCSHLSLMLSKGTATEHDHLNTKEDTHVQGGVVQCLYHEVMTAPHTIKANNSTGDIIWLLWCCPFWCL